jgi:hypothetical protein
MIAPADRTAAGNRLSDSSPPMVADALAALEMLSWRDSEGGGWVGTGAVADALGCGVREAAARLRAANRRGLCMRHRSLVYGMRWRPTPRIGGQSGVDEAQLSEQG